MSVQPIRLFGDPVLRTPAVEVVDFDRQLRRLVDDLTDTMLEAGGAGLAAPQIGVGLRVFTYHVEGAVGHLVNPSVEVLGDEIQLGDEGCLSIPGMSWDCKRHLNVIARGQDVHSEPVVLDASQMLARCIEHEVDHLDGVLFVDRLDPQTRKQALRAIRGAEWFGDQIPTVKISPHPLLGKAR